MGLPEPYMATGEDESPEAVDVRQDLGLSRIKPGKNKSSEKEKEKKAKEIQKEVGMENKIKKDIDLSLIHI